VAHQKKVVADFDISEFLDNRKSQLATPVRDGDLVKIFPILGTTHDVVYLTGHVARPGSYEFNEGMKLLDLIPSFDPLLPEPYLEHADIKRLMPPDLHPETISFNLGRLLNGDPLQNIELKEQDMVTIYSKESLQEIPQVTISGEVQKPGEYRLLKKMRVKDLIFNSGNVKRSAYLPEAELTRLTKTETGVISRVVNINLREALRENPEHNLVLEEDDHLFVRQIPKWYTDNTVTLRGEVKYPGDYSFRKGERLSSVIARAGGVTEHGYLKGAVFTRESAKRIQEERLKGFIDELEEDILKSHTRLNVKRFWGLENGAMEQGSVPQFLTLPVSYL
jgi:protein involved in polysaccharide export with SLBB domain